MNDPYEHIHMATNEMLAEMLEDKLDTGYNAMHLDVLEFMECIREAAARLRERHKEPFNHEAFNL